MLICVNKVSIGIPPLSRGQRLGTEYLLNKARQVQFVDSLVVQIAKQIKITEPMNLGLLGAPVSLGAPSSSQLFLVGISALQMTWLNEVYISSPLTF